MLREDWLPATFSKVIHKRREYLRISQEELSQRSGLHRTYISDVERGARNVSLKNMSKLAAALEISPSALMRWTEMRNANALGGLILEPEFLAYLDGMGAGYVLLEQGGAVINANGVFAEWLARSIETLVGTRFVETVADDDRAKVQAALEAVRVGTFKDALKVRLKLVSGELLPVLLQLDPIKDESDEYSMTRINVSQSSTAAGASSSASAELLPLSRIDAASLAPHALHKAISGGIPMAAMAIKGDVISFWNEAAHDLFGYSVSEALGAPVTLIVPEARLPELNDVSARARQGFARQQLDVRYKSKSNSPLNLSMTCVPVPDLADEPQLLCFFSCASQRSSGTDFLSLQLAVVSALEESESFTEAVPGLLAAFAGDRFHFAMLWWVDPDSGHLRPFGHTTIDLPPDAVQSLTEGIRFLSNGLPRIVWETRQPFWIPDVSREPRSRPQVSANQLGLVSGVWFPITVGREVIGVFELLSKDSLPQDDQTIEVFSSLGSRIGRSILRSGERPRISETGTTSQSKQVVT